jgi:hypothetical protein
LQRGKDKAIDIDHGWKNKKRVSHEEVNMQSNTKPRRGFT